MILGTGEKIPFKFERLANSELTTFITSIIIIFIMSSSHG
jgi:hypothetical protein